MSDVFLANSADRGDVMKDRGDGIANIPGIGEYRLSRKGNLQGITRYLGRGEGLDASGPWVYLNEFEKGSVIKFHQHNAARIEFIIEGEIEWREPGKTPQRFGANHMSYVDAGTVYGYEVLEDVKILLVFNAAPTLSSL
ncbi:MAG TPA: hypothetical protein VJ476_15445 [Rhizomicrobium sp.]|nr:hypothetical protein [Rhizomicrobium sp.]